MAALMEAEQELKVGHHQWQEDNPPLLAQMKKSQLSQLEMQDKDNKHKGKG